MSRFYYKTHQILENQPFILQNLVRTTKWAVYSKTQHGVVYKLEIILTSLVVYKNEKKLQSPVVYNIQKNLKSRVVYKIGKNLKSRVV